jgi:hypothetical protein
MKNSTLIKLVTATCACILALFACFPVEAERAAAQEKAELGHGEMYPKLTVVIESTKVDDLWLVSCLDREGNVWTFWDDEGTWAYGDIANLLMWDIGEEEIIEVYWEGYTENVELFFQIMEWR